MGGGSGPAGIRSPFRGSPGTAEIDPAGAGTLLSPGVVAVGVVSAALLPAALADIFVAVVNHDGFTLLSARMHRLATLLTCGSWCAAWPATVIGAGGLAALIAPFGDHRRSG